VKIVGSRLTSEGGAFHLDGEFNGYNIQSGNGVDGGNYEFQVKNDKSETPLVRMYTSEGLITLRMRGDLAPNTFRNFMNYANTLRYDNIFFTRSINSPSPFIIQGGSLQITGDGTSASDVVATTEDTGIAEEFSVTNARGTVAMAKSSLPNSTTNQFFFNMADNSSLDSQQFSVFAELYGAPSLAAADAINAKPNVDLTSQINDPSGHTDLQNVPVQDATQATAGVNPNRDFVLIRRVAMRSHVAAL
jgi:peptidyl-prolyl cis-trans isomerase A (cyclophilin A)